MKSWVVTGLTAVACLLGGTSELFAQYYDEAPSAGAAGSGAPPDAKADGAAKPKKAKARRRRAPSSSSSSREDYEDSGRRVWTETASARVKTVYDDQGNVVYQKAWDKKSGKEVPVPEAGRGAEEDTSRAQDVHREPEARPYGRLRRDEDGEYEERRQDPRPSHGKSHHMHNYSPDARKHPYEFSLGVYPWLNVLDGELKGTAGTGKIVNDERTSYVVDFHNQRVGWSYTRIEHSAKLTGTFTFSGTTFAADAVDTIYRETLNILDGFFRFNCYDGRDAWLDFLVGAKVLVIDSDVTSAVTVPESVDTVVPLPQLGIIGSYSLLDNIKLRGHVKGAFGALSDASATAIDAEAEFVYTFPGDREYNVLNQFSLGYKYLQLDFTNNADSADEASGSLSHDGPFVKYQALF